MSANIEQVYVANPSTTLGNNDLLYTGKSPYAATDNSAIKYSDLLTQIKAAIGFSVTPQQIKFVAENGSDVTGSGSFNNPYATPLAASVAIVDATILKPYVIYTISGDYSMATLPLKPFISYLTMGRSKLTVAGGITADATWSGASNGYCYFGGFELVSAINFDLGAITVASPKLYLQNLISSSTLTLVGTGSGTDLATIENCNFSSNHPTYTNFSITSRANYFGGSGNIQVSCTSATDAYIVDMQGDRYYDAQLIQGNGSTMAVIRRNVKQDHNLSIVANNSPAATYVSLNTDSASFGLNSNSIPDITTDNVDLIGGGTIYGVLSANVNNQIKCNVLTDGQLLIGDTGADPVAATLTAGTGVNITNAAGAITINSTGSGVEWNVITASGTHDLLADNGYISDTVATADYEFTTTPGDYPVGSVVAVSGGEAPGWTITVPLGVTVLIGDITYTGATTISSNSDNDVLYFLCVKADTLFFGYAANDAALIAAGYTSPTNYTPVDNSIKGHLQGINTKLGTIVSSNIRYVASTGSDSNNGSFSSPFLMIAHAYAAITTASLANQFAIVLLDNNYTETNQISIKPHIALFSYSPNCTINNSLAIEIDSATWTALSGAGYASMQNINISGNVDLDFDVVGAAAASYLKLDNVTIGGTCTLNGNSEDSANLYCSNLQVVGNTNITNFITSYSYDAIYAGTFKNGSTTAATSNATSKSFNDVYLGTFTVQTNAAEALNCNFFLYGAELGSTVTADGNKAQIYYDPTSYKTNTVRTNGAPAPITPTLALARVYSAQQNFAAQALTDAATISWNLETQQSATILLTAGVGATRAMGTPTNLVNGGTYTLKVTQSSGGANALTWPSAFKWPGGLAPVLSVAANAVDVFSFISDGTNLYGNFSLGMA